MVKHYTQLLTRWETAQQITKQVCVSEEFPTNQWDIDHFNSLGQEAIKSLVGRVWSGK